MHYWADLQSVHGFRCYDNIHVCKLVALCTANAYSAERKILASACTRSVVHVVIVKSVIRTSNCLSMDACHVLCGILQDLQVKRNVKVV